MLVSKPSLQEQLDALDLQQDQGNPISGLPDAVTRADHAIAMQAIEARSGRPKYPLGYRSNPQHVPPR